MPAVDRPVEQRDRHAAAGARAGDRACGRARATRAAWPPSRRDRACAPGTRRRPRERPAAARSDPAARSPTTALRALTKRYCTFTAMPTRASASRSSCCVAVAVLAALGLSIATVGWRRQDDDHLQRQRLAGAPVADHRVPRAQRLLDRIIRRTQRREHDGPGERRRERENERARAQAAAARHDPLRVHDPAGDSARSPGCSARERAARVGVEREVLAGLERARGEGRGADHRRVVDAQRGRQQAAAARRGARRPRPARRAARRWPPRRRPRRAPCDRWRPARPRRARRAAARSPPGSRRRDRRARPAARRRARARAAGARS